MGRNPQDELSARELASADRSSDQAAGGTGDFAEEHAKPTFAGEDDDRDEATPRGLAGMDPS